MPFEWVNKHTATRLFSVRNQNRSQPIQNQRIKNQLKDMQKPIPFDSHAKMKQNTSIRIKRNWKVSKGIKKRIERNPNRINKLRVLVFTLPYRLITCFRGEPKGIGWGIGSGVKMNQFFESALPPEPKTLYIWHGTPHHKFTMFLYRFASPQCGRRFLFFANPRAALGAWRRPPRRQ